MSAPSPSTGAATRARGRANQKQGVTDETRTRPAERLEVGLEHMRWRHFGWALFGLVGGALLLWKLGTVAQSVGVVLLLVAAVAIWHFVRTLLHPAGVIVIDGRRAVLPRGLCRGRSVEVGLDEVRHAYFLRRSVPWTWAAPVLVIETDREAFTYPRDWFASEADQRRIVSRLVEALRPLERGEP